MEKSIIKKTAQKKRKPILDPLEIAKAVRKVSIDRTTFVKFDTVNQCWFVIKGNQQNTIKSFKYKNSAIKEAFAMAKQYNTEITICAKNGKMLSSSRYGNLRIERVGA